MTICNSISFHFNVNFQWMNSAACKTRAIFELNLFRIDANIIIIITIEHTQQKIVMDVYFTGNVLSVHNCGHGSLISHQILFVCFIESAAMGRIIIILSICFHLTDLPVSISMPIARLIIFSIFFTVIYLLSSFFSIPLAFLPLRSSLLLDLHFDDDRALFGGCFGACVRI